MDCKISIDEHHAQNSPSSKTLEILFLCVLPSQFQLTEETEAQGTKLVTLANLSDLPKNCTQDIEKAWDSLKKKCRFDSTVFDFLNTEFSLSELQKLFEAITGKPVDVRNFRKKIESLEILTASANKPRGMAYRPPRLYLFNRNKFESKVTEDGEVRFF